MNIATTNAIAKIAAVVAGLGLVSMSFAFAVPAKAATVDELQAQINALLAQIASLQGGSSSSASVTFTMDLTIGSTGAEVTALQNWLISKGYSIPAGATGYFGAQTQAALAAFQAANGISPAAGYFGPITRAKVNAMGGADMGGDDDDDDDDSDFEGDDEGYLDDFERVSSYTAEEVGEGEEDVTVLAVEMEAVDADQKIERVTVEFDNPEDTTNTDELDEIVTEVSLWLDGEELDRMEVDEASYDRDGGTSSNGLYTFRFTNLDGVISEGDMGELAVAVTGDDNVDTASEGDTFDVFIPADGIRAVSPNGVDDTYDSAAFETTFSVESFASANEIELNSSTGDNNPDEGVVLVEDEGESILLLEGELRAEGSGVTIFDLPVQVVTTGATDVDTVIDELVLEIDGEEFSENVSTSAVTNTTITFDDLNIEMEEDDTITYTVTGKSATSSVDAVQAVTLIASTTVASIDAEDESGENLGSADLTGTAAGETQHLFSTVADITVVSADIDPQSANDEGDITRADATIVVEVEALGGTIYINGHNESTENTRFFVGKVYGSGVSASSTASTTVFTVENVEGSYTVTNEGADNEYYTIEEGEKVEVTIEAAVTISTYATRTTSQLGLQALLFQFGTSSSDQDTRSAVNLNWSDLTDQTKTGTTALNNDAD